MADRDEVLRRFTHRDLSSWRPRPRDLPTWRAALVPCWQPGGTWGRVAQATGQFVPPWEIEILSAAQLWFVGSGMCDLLVSAAEQLPETALASELVPDPAGLVVFEAPLSGIDAEGSANPVAVAAYLWGPARWKPEGAEDLVAGIGVTVYGPLLFEGAPLHSPYLMPLGRLFWPVGYTCDFSIGEATLPGGPDDQDDQWLPRDLSMREDRRRLLALWLLSGQPGLTSNVVHEPQARSKAKAKRVAAGRVLPPAPVRVIQLRRPPPHDPGTPSGGRRTFRHRWTVGGHWRNQAKGSGYSEHELIYINPYLKGPADAPLLSTDKVKAWTR